MAFELVEAFMDSQIINLFLEYIHVPGVIATFWSHCRLKIELQWLRNVATTLGT